MALLLIALIIIAVDGVRSQWAHLGSIRAEAADLAHASVQLRAYRHSAAARSTKAMHDLTSAPMVIIDQRIAALETSLQRNSGRASRTGLVDAVRSEGGMMEALTKSASRQIDVELQKQELDHLQRVRAYAVGGLAYQRAQARLASLQRQHQTSYEAFQQNKRVIEKLGPVDRLRYDRPWSHDARLAALARSHRQLATRNEQAAAAYRVQLVAMSRIRQVQEVTQFAVDFAPLDRVQAQFAERLASAESLLAEHWIEQAIRLLTGSLPAAGMLLSGAIAAHLFLKSVFYFVLAPLAERRPPIVLAPHVSGHISLRAAEPAESLGYSLPQSRVSQLVRLGPAEHMLVLPDYMQSATRATLKDTKWLLDWSRPATSLLAGMTSLTRLRPTAAGQHAVLSSGRDPLSELALIELDAGAAVDFNPERSSA